MKITVPWNACWSSEEHYEVRPCRWAGGSLAIWSPHSPGIGRPIFARPHMVRQRKSVALMLCTVCGNATPPNDRWWFQLGEFRDGYFMTTEAPVHRACADFALTVCPHLQKTGSAVALSRFPKSYIVLSAIVGGAATDRDFGVKIAGRKVIGHMKFAWPAGTIDVSKGVAP